MQMSDGSMADGIGGGLVEIDDQGKVIRSADSADSAFPGALLIPWLPRSTGLSTNSSMHQENIFAGTTHIRCGAYRM
jgi:hypothetical protein